MANTFPAKNKSPAFGGGFVENSNSVFVHAAGEGYAILMQENIQLDAVGTHKALGKLIDHSGLGIGTALNKESTAAGLGVEHLCLLAAHEHSFVGVNCIGRNNANFIEEAIEAMGLEKFLGELGIYILGIKAGFKNEGFSVHMADTHKAVNLGIRAAKLKHLDNVGSGVNDLKLDQGGRGGHAHGAYFAGEGINHFRFAANLGLCHEGSASLLADNKAFAFKSTDGLSHGGAGYIKGFAKLGLAGKKISGCESPRGDITLYYTYKLRIKRNVAVYRESAEEYGVLFHSVILSERPASHVLNATLALLILFD